MSKRSNTTTESRLQILPAGADAESAWSAVTGVRKSVEEITSTDVLTYHRAGAMTRILGAVKTDVRRTMIQTGGGDPSKIRMTTESRAILDADASRAVSRVLGVDASASTIRHCAMRLIKRVRSGKLTKVETIKREAAKIRALESYASAVDGVTVQILAPPTAPGAVAMFESRAVTSILESLAANGSILPPAASTEAAA